MPSPKGDSEESDWNENLYAHQYRAKVQSQVPIRQHPPGWFNWTARIKNKSVNSDNNVNNTNTASSLQGLWIIETVSISREAFDALD